MSSWAQLSKKGFLYEKNSLITAILVAVDAVTYVLLDDIFLNEIETEWI